MGCDLSGNSLDGREVGFAIFPGRGSDGYENDPGVPDGRRDVGGKRKAAVLNVAQDHFPESGFIDGHFSGVKFINLIFNIVHTDNVIAEV